MPSKAKPLSKADLDAYESKRDLAAELLESVRQMKAGKTRVVHSPAVEARAHGAVAVAVRGAARRLGAHAAEHRPDEPEGTAGRCGEVAHA